MRARALDQRLVLPVRAAPLPIRRRMVLRADGTLLVQRIAHCPRRMRSIGADVCAGCADFTGTTRSPLGDPAVACRERTAVAAEQRVQTLPPGSASADGLPIHRCLARSLWCIERGAPADRMAEILAKCGPDGALLVDDDLVPLAHLRAGQPELPFAGPVNELASMAQAAAVLAYEDRDRAAIVDSDGAAVGLLSARDVLRWLATGAGYLVPEEPGASG